MPNQPRKTVPYEDILGPAEVRELAGGITRGTFARWRSEFGFPEPVRVIEAAELWDRREVVAWLERAKFRRRRRT